LDLKEKIKLRKANNTDVKITYQWATNPVVRAFSFHKHTITKDEHTSWFQNKLADIKCLYLIAEMDNSKIGSIQFDIRGNEAIISYLIDPEQHGKGLGQIILIRGLEYIFDVSKKNALNFQKVVGYVMKTNIPSLKAFERLGFEKYEEDNKFKFEMKIS
jgi:RimJ/RimL family protein N-acetyltransferase